MKAINGHRAEIIYLILYHVLNCHLFYLQVYKKSYEETNGKHSNKNINNVHTSTTTAGWQK